MIAFLLFTLFGCTCLVYAQTVQVPDSIKTKVLKRIETINELIKQKGYKWKAGITPISYYTDKQLKNLCGEQYDPSKLKEDSLAQVKMYNDYIKSENKGLYKTSTIPSWQSLMTTPELQSCKNCWAYATTGVIEGLLHNLYGSNIGINLNEDSLTNHTCSGCGGGTAYCSFSYVQASKVPSKKGVNSFPNYDNAYYTISSNNVYEPTGISTIKTLLSSSPVYASMQVYDDFYDYKSGIYHHTSGEYKGNHAVVIVGYDDNNQCWTCKNSWGPQWGENSSGYFRIAYGECGIDYLRSGVAAV